MVEFAYGLYLSISLGMTIWVAHTLHSHGEVFLIQCFGHNEILAKSTNDLLVVGFYLINIGWILLTLRYGAEPTSWAEAIKFVSSKVGLAVLVLGGMHFFNMHAIARFGRKVSEWLNEGHAKVYPA
jgi:hypothetical protein